LIGHRNHRPDATPPAPLILFGAFDRHNLGDMLLAHVAAREAGPRPVVFAGLAERDLTDQGGQRVRAIADLAREWGDARADLAHVGGELLTCDLYQAAVMVQSETEARAAIARYDADPAGGLEWAMTTLGLRQRMAYLVPKSLFRNPGRFIFRAVGGTDLDTLSAPQRDEVLDRLREADALGVRDRITRDRLAEAGIPATLEPDPVSRVATLFGEIIARHADSGEPAEVKEAFPAGYLAIQFAAEYGDDASLAILASDLHRKAGGKGLVLFRAGAAPWHDDPATYRRLARLMPNRRVHLFRSLHVWDICALIAAARGYCGTSLHAGIVSRTFGVENPPFPLTARSTKSAAYSDTWYVSRAPA
jgi:hypothetical protein